MILRHFDCDVILGENGSRVTCVGTDYLRLGDNNDCGGASSETLGVLREGIFLELSKLLFALLCQHEIIQPEEAFFKSLLVALALVASKLLQFLGEVLLDVKSHLLT